MFKRLLRKFLSPKEAVIVDAVVQEAAEKAGKAVLKNAGKVVKGLK